MQKKVEYNQQFFNEIEEAKIDAGDVSASYETLIDLGQTYTRSSLLIENSLDENVKLNFVNTETGIKEITISAEKDYSLEDFEHNGIIQIKAESGLPATGDLILKSW
jgi:hypothetical protein